MERPQGILKAATWTPLFVTAAVDKMKRHMIVLGARMNAKKCSVCRQSLPMQRRSDRRYCDVRCRVRAYRLRAAGMAAQETSATDHDVTAAELAAVTASAAAAALLVETLRQQFQEANAARETQANELTKLRGHFQKTEAARLAAVHEAAIERSKLFALSDDYYEAEKSISDLAEEKAQLAQELTTLRAAKPRRTALSEASKQRQKRQAQELRDRVRDRDKQIRELNRKLLATERTHQKQLTAHTPTEEELRHKVGSLTRQLKTAHAEVDRLTRSLDKKKKSNKKLKKTLDEEQSRGLFSRLFSGGSKRPRSSGSDGEQDKPRRRDRLGAGNPEPRALPAEPARALPAQRKSLPPKSES